MFILRFSLFPINFIDIYRNVSAGIHESKTVGVLRPFLYGTRVTLKRIFLPSLHPLVKSLVYVSVN